MKILSLTIAILLFSESAISQSLFKQNTVYFQLGGNGLFTSFNYERQLSKKPGLGIHAGSGIYGFNPSYFTLPIGLNYILKFKHSNSFISFGLGITYSKADVKLYATVDHKDPSHVNTNYWNYIPSVGFRNLTKKNLMYCFSITPVFNQYDGLPFLGFSIGKSF